jgi:hypothetical protein
VQNSFCLVARGKEGTGREWRGEGRRWGKREEMTQTLYAHVNKIKIKKKERLSGACCQE